MKLLLSTAIPITIYRYLSDYGPNDEPVSSVTLGTYESMIAPSIEQTGWRCKAASDNSTYCYSGAYKNEHCNNDPNEISGSGFTVDSNSVILLFDKLIGKEWANKTLADCDIELAYAPFPIATVDFSPSIENISIAIFNRMKPALEKELNVKLSYVEVFRPNGTFVRCSE